MAKLKWTEEAVTWLHRIYDYIAEDNPQAAANVIEGIHEKARLLRKYPQLGYLYRNVPEGEIRILLYGHYRIANLILETDIKILGVFHGAMDIHKLLPSSND